MPSLKLAGAAGILATVLATIGFALAPLWDLPPTTATVAEVGAFNAAHAGSLRAEVLLDTVTVTLWLVFGLGVWQRLRRADGGDAFASSCFAGGLVAFVTLLLAGFTFSLVLCYREGRVADPRLFVDMTFGLLAMSGAPTAVALTAYAAHVFASRTLPRSTALLAVVAAVAHVVLLASFVARSGFFSLEGEVIVVLPATLFLWITATAIALLRAEA